MYICENHGDIYENTPRIGKKEDDTQDISLSNTTLKPEESDMKTINIIDEKYKNIITNVLDFVAKGLIGMGISVYYL